jgi:hypothetical protein
MALRRMDGVSAVGVELVCVDRVSCIATSYFSLARQ